MSIDSIGDFLTIIRNGISRGRSFVVAPYSVLKRDIAQTLKNEGFIRDFALIDELEVKKQIKIYLKYVGGESVIHEITRISSPGCRRYAQVRSHGRHKIKPVIGGLGVSILTTNKGVVSHKQAKAMGIGGEVICTVW